MTQKDFETFEDCLENLLKASQDHAVSFKTILEILSGRGKALLLIFLSLPFSQIVGLAIPFGLFIAYVGFRLAFDGGIWLPSKILHKKVPSKILTKVVKKVLHAIRKMKKFSYPRHLGMCMHPAMKISNGLMIAVVGIFIAISPIVPFSSFIAAIGILFMGIGILNDDGIFIILGYVFSLFYIGIIIVSMKLYCMLGDKLKSCFKK